jgi:type IV pilus assembly protein PilE
MQTKKQFLGFTLVELLVAMAIIAVLIGLAIGAISLVQRVSRDSERRSAVSEVTAALNAYYGSNSRYPSSISMTTNGDIQVGTLTVDLKGAAVGATTGDTTTIQTVYCYRLESDGYRVGAILEENLSTTNAYLNLSIGSIAGLTNAYQWCITNRVA